MEFFSMLNMLASTTSVDASKIFLRGNDLDLLTGAKQGCGDMPTPIPIDALPLAREKYHCLRAAG
jgi:hypothetical protein